MLPASQSSERLAQTAVMNDKNTVDKGEVEHMSAYAKEWWDEKGPIKGLHSMNALRVPFVRDGLLKIGKISETKALSSDSLSGLKVLDVGCGGGILSIPLARMGADVTGLDPSAELIEVAKAHAKSVLTDEKITFECSTIEEHQKNNKEIYDAVVCSEVLEHISSKEDFLQCCIDVLKSQGSLFITTINKTTVSWLGAIIAAEYILRLLPIGTHEYEKFVSPERVTEILEKKCCDTRYVHGMAYEPITNTWHWTSITLINYGLHAVKR